MWARSRRAKHAAGVEWLRGPKTSDGVMNRLAAGSWLDVGDGARSGFSGGPSRRRLIGPRRRRRRRHDEKVSVCVRSAAGRPFSPTSPARSPAAGRLPLVFVRLVYGVLSPAAPKVRKRPPITGRPALACMAAHQGSLVTMFCSVFRGPREPRRG
jgi:hypothetical protein